MAFSFGSLEVAYDELVLAPRRWTLLQSEWAAELSPDLPEGPLLELCAGVGHIGLEAARRTGRFLVQVEADAHAAQLAQRNAAAAGVVCEVRARPLEEAIAPNERYPLILADPPYIPTGDLARFPDDPRRAIDGGPDGLDVVRACVEVARAHLVARGALLLQTRGAQQAEAVAASLAEKLGLQEIRSVDDERAVALITRLA